MPNCQCQYQEKQLSNLNFSCSGYYLKQTHSYLKQIRSYLKQICSYLKQTSSYFKQTRFYLKKIRFYLKQTSSYLKQPCFYLKQTRSYLKQTQTLQRFHKFFSIKIKHNLNLIAKADLVSQKQIMSIIFVTFCAKDIFFDNGTCHFSNSDAPLDLESGWMVSKGVIRVMGEFPP